MKNAKDTTPKCLVTHNAAKAIIKDSRQFIDETGGVLVGTLGNPLTIVAAGFSGENSRHHATSFTSDAQADQDCLAAARRTYGGGIEVVGWWHKHPSGFECPSEGDCRQVRLLMKDYNDGKPILMGIVNKKAGLVRDQLSLRLFSLNSDGELLQHPWKRLDDSSKQLLEAINDAPQRPELRKTEFWSEPDFQSYQNPIGRDRILREINALKQAGWSVNTARRKSDKVMILYLTKNEIYLQMELPPEFPLNPPTVFANNIRLTGLGLRGAWNSLCPLTEWAKYAESITANGHC